MKAIIQRVSQASVTVEQQTVGEIKQGLLVLLGVAQEDTIEQAEKMLDKIIKMRIFSDAEGKMNLSLLDISGELLVVSQFTLFADTSGRRPSFSKGAKPDHAQKIYQQFLELGSQVVKCQAGVFGAEMQVNLTNDGPVTISLEVL